MDEELKAFQREDRYIVIKRKDLAALADKGELRPASLDGLVDLCADLPAREYVVIESDWPEYPIVWQMIKARMNGRSQLPGQGGEAVAELSSDEILMAFEENGFRIEPGASFSAKGQIAQLLNAVGAILSAHPADQVADDLTMVKVSRELLQDLRDLAFDQVEHHRAAMGAYKQTRQSAMDSVLAQADALLRS